MYSKKVFIKTTLFLVSFLTLISSYGQEFPPIERFAPKDYNADDQNWSISQGTDENIYVSNNKGLLEYNGARWNLYTTTNQSIIRSVAVINDLVYTGSYMDFGFWKRDNFGKLIYESISQNLNEGLVEDEEFWSIIPYGEFVLFQSLDRIYIYNTSKKSFRIIESSSSITKAFRVDETIYFQEVDRGIFKIENGKSVLISDDVLFKQEYIVNIFNNNDKLLIQSRESGFYEYDDIGLKKWNIPSNPLLSSVSVYNSIRLRNGNFILGTISNGVIMLDANGKLLFQMNKNSGLSNNTVLSAFQDITGNIWMGLDNGINVLNLNSPYRVYIDNQGYLGTVYASEKTSKNLYLGTNQGLFYRPINSSEKFKLIPNTEGQVWFLKQINGTLFCGHDKGSFEIKDNKAIEISGEEGTWIIKPIEGMPNLLIKGNYNGLSVIEKSSEGKWRLRNIVEGFDISSRYFEFVKGSEILVSHEYKGVYKLKLDDNFLNVA